MAKTLKYPQISSLSIYRTSSISMLCMLIVLSTIQNSRTLKKAPVLLYVSDPQNSLQVTLTVHGPYTLKSGSQLLACVLQILLFCMIVYSQPPPLCKKTLSKNHSQSTEDIKQTNSFHVILFIISYVNLEVTQFTKAFAKLSLVLKIYNVQLSIRIFLLDLQY